MSTELNTQFVFNNFKEKHLLNNKIFKAMLFSGLLGTTHFVHAADTPLTVINPNFTNLGSWDDPIGLTKSRIYSAYLSRAKSFDFSEFSNISLPILPSVVSVLNGYFWDLDKTKLPQAPKDNNGNYYLEIEPSDDQVKAVTVPTEFGNLHIDLTVLNIIKDQMPYLRKSINQKESSSFAADLFLLRIEGVTSPNLWPKVESLPLYNFINATTGHDHGGAWVGITSFVFGSADNPKITTTACGIPAESREVKLKIYELGIYIGQWQARYVLTPSSCQSGQIKVTAVSNIPPYTSLTSVVEFK